MEANVLIVYYSSYGHTFKMAQAVEEGARSVEGVEVRLRRVQELEDARKAMSSQEYYVKAQQEQEHIPVATLDDLVWADGICWGIPTRYGNMPAQVKQFIDSTGPLWSQGKLEDKVAGIFTSTATIHGGQESTVLTSLVPLLHLGMIIVGTPYHQNQHILTVDGIGGSPYGPGTLSGPDGSRQPDERELQGAMNLGSRVARMATAVRTLEPVETE